MTAAAEPSNELIEALISDIDRTHNYRRSYDKAKLDEMAESIDANGVLQPVVVRPGTNGKPWVLVIGERRVRASLLAKRSTVPAIVRRDLGSDAEARAVSIIENLQREDVDPLEEADGFKELYDPPSSWPVEKIAAQVGQKRSYVYGRLKLCSLCDAGREAYRKGQLDVSAAILIARIPSPEVQAKAVGDLKHWGNASYDQIARHVHDKFMLRLAGAPFDTADEKLVPAAGSCAKCPKRTGNQRELFADVKSADVCTDPPCFKVKADAAWLVTAAAAEKKGAKVLDDKAAAKLFPYGSNLAHEAPFIDLADDCFSDKKQRPYKKLIARGTPVILARDPAGKVHELLPRAELQAAIKTSGVKLDSYETRTRGQGGASEAKARKAAERKRAVVKAAIAEVVAKAKPTAAFFRALLGMLIRGGYHDAMVNLAKRRGWVEKGKQPKTIVEAKAKAMGDAELPALVIELAMSRDAYWTHAVGMPDSVKAAAGAFGVDLKAIEKRVADERAKKEKAKPTKKGGAK
jgi:ParB/RepB/Spo0J family partition protein